MEGVEGARAAVVAAFEKWMRQLPSAPTRGVDLVRDVMYRRRTVGRLTSEIEGRKLVWQDKPAAVKQPLSPVPVDASRLDPWNPPRDLEHASRYVCTCDACGGEGKLTCGLCRGSARVRCDDCNGEGKRWGHAKNGARRLLNCQSCRGKGDLKCDYCSRGRVDCDTCKTSKKLERWLSVDTWSRTTTLSHPPVDFGNEPIERDATIIATARGHSVAATDLSEASGWIEDGWNRVQPELARGERVYAQRFELLDVPSADLTYSVFGRQQTVTFDGLRLCPPSVASDRVFARRSKFLKLGLVASALLLVIFALCWIQRGAYFTTDRPSGYLAISLLGLAVICGLAYRGLWNFTLGRRRRAKFWMAPALVPALFVGASICLSSPSIERARSYLALHDLPDTEIELSGLGADADDVRADLGLARVMDAKTCIDASKLTSAIAAASKQHARAIAYADDLALAGAKDALGLDHPQEASLTLNCATQTLRDGPRGHAMRAAIALTMARDCRARSDWDCTFMQVKAAEQLGSKDATALAQETYAQIETELDQTLTQLRAERDTSKRVDLERIGLVLATHLEQPSSPVASADVALLTSANKRDTAQLARDEEAARRRAEAEERRQAQLAAQAEARRQAQEQREAAAASAFEGALMCNDGTESPSCTCGGSHRGCCSHHGGVAGCR